MRRRLARRRRAGRDCAECAARADGSGVQVRGSGAERRVCASVCGLAAAGGQQGAAVRSVRFGGGVFLRSAAAAAKGRTVSDGIASVARGSSGRGSSPAHATSPHSHRAAHGRTRSRTARKGRWRKPVAEQRLARGARPWAELFGALGATGKKRPRRHPGRMGALLSTLYGLWFGGKEYKVLMVRMRRLWEARGRGDGGWRKSGKPSGHRA
eukprot:363338-Chlamydomonas_euryale.AAC.2